MDCPCCEHSTQLPRVIPAFRGHWSCIGDLATLDVSIASSFDTKTTLGASVMLRIFLFCSVKKSLNLFACFWGQLCSGGLLCLFLKTANFPHETFPSGLWFPLFQLWNILSWFLYNLVYFIWLCYIQLMVYCEARFSHCLFQFRRICLSDRIESLCHAVCCRMVALRVFRGARFSITAKRHWL